MQDTVPGVDGTISRRRHPDVDISQLVPKHREEEDIKLFTKQLQRVVLVTGNKSEILNLSFLPGLVR